MLNRLDNPDDFAPDFHSLPVMPEETTQDRRLKTDTLYPERKKSDKKFIEKIDKSIDKIAGIRKRLPNKKTVLKALNQTVIFAWYALCFIFAAVNITAACSTVVGFVIMLFFSLFITASVFEDEEMMPLILAACLGATIAVAILLNIAGCVIAKYFGITSVIYYFILE